MGSSTHWVLCCGLCGFSAQITSMPTSSLSSKSSFFSVPAPPYAFLLWYFVLFEYHIPSLPTTWPARISIQLQLPSNSQNLFLLPYLRFVALSVIMLALSGNLAFSAFLHKLRTKHWVMNKIYINRCMAYGVSTRYISHNNAPMNHLINMVRSCWLERDLILYD